MAQILVYVEDTKFLEVKAWMTSHDCTITGNAAIGVKFTWEFTPTSIGEIVKLRCACQEKFDATDYDSF